MIIAILLSIIFSFLLFLENFTSECYTGQSAGYLI
uniref:Uncharacterized protein n=1 Tax=Arundo donax TaxID=35708 RepID=A0A0A9CPX6_ARUDO